MIVTTLNAIRAHHPCAYGWQKILRHLGKTQPDDEPLPLVTILESNDIADALWCLRSVEGYEKEKRLFAVWCARQVQHRMTDPRSVAALDVAESFAHGKATQEELAAANYAAWAAADELEASYTAAAYTAAAYTAATDAAAAAWAAAWAAAVDVVRAAQAEKFKEIFG